MSVLSCDDVFMFRLSQSQLLDELSTVKLVSNKENIEAYLKSVC